MFDNEIQFSMRMRWWVVFFFPLLLLGRSRELWKGGGRSESCLGWIGMDGSKRTEIAKASNGKKTERGKMSFGGVKWTPLPRDESGV